jgi:hypothetical protein
MFQLGNVLRDRITGFEGIATARVEYLNGCIQFCLKRKIGADGKMPEAEYIDSQQLEFVGDGLAVVQTATGGVMPDTPPTDYRG